MMNRIWVWGCFLALTGCSGAAFTGEFAPDSGEADVVGQGDGGGASRSSSSSSGSSSSRTSSSSSADAASVDVDASSCDGGPLYLHHVGLLGLT